ncbi:hypothetical protein TL16_g03961 [Triparma laevis f. inornata]|nr:hypothetical protein TL16_g03961 [Triparma laevis f. inornata]GMI00760.1 hypothetical protein TrLO_g9728 [Triparma laevis f. longispina]
MSAEYELRIVKTINEKLKKQFDDLKQLIDEQAGELDLMTTELADTTAEKEKLLELLENTCCPITREPIRDEVINVADAHRYEKEAIEEWLTRSNSSPVTRALTGRSDIQTLKRLCEGVQRLSTAEQNARRLESDLDEEMELRSRSERHVAALRETLIERDERLATAHRETRFYKTQNEKGSADLQAARQQLRNSPYNAPVSPRRAGSLMSTPRLTRSEILEHHVSTLTGWEESVFARTPPNLYPAGPQRSRTEEDLNRSIRNILSSLKIELHRKGASDASTKCAVFYARRLISEIKR